jgi:outer membrane protein TolC
MKANHLFILGWILVLLAPGTIAKSQESFSLEEAIVYAQQNGFDVQLDKLNIADAEAQIDEYYAIGLPKINGNVSYQYAIEIPTQVLPDFISPSVYNVLFDEDILERRDLEINRGLPAQFGVPHTLDLGVELQTLILDGSYVVGLRAQRLYRELVQHEHATVLYDTKKKVTEAYLTVLNLDNNVSLLEDNISNLQKLYDETKAIYESGFAEKLDVDRLNLSLRNLIAERDNLKRLSEVAQLALKFNMGYPLENDITLTDNFQVLADQAAVEGYSAFPEFSLSDRPEYSTLETAVELQNTNVKRLKFGYLPTLSGFINYGQTLQRQDLFDSNDNGWFPRSIVGVNLAVPIFDGLDRNAKIQRAKISRDNTLIQKSLFEQSTALEVNSNYISYLNAKEKVASNKANLELAKEIYDVTQIKFREGVGSSVEVTQAESEWYRAQTNYSSAQFELIMSLNDLKASLGKL